MKTKFCVGILLLLAATVAPAQTNSLTALLQQGLFEEQANRNLDAAIADYQSLALQFDQDRQLAATAVFRLGECYRAQGRTNEAAAQYQRILHDFADQQTLVLLSREDLAGMGIAGNERAVVTGVDKTSVLTSVALSDLEKEFVMLRSQLEQARGETNYWFVAKLFGDSNLESALGKLEGFESNLSTLKQNPSLTNSPSSAGIADFEAIIQAEHQEVEQARKTLFDYQGLRLRSLAAALSEVRGLSATNLPVSMARPFADEEDKEITRIQQMIQNSPDLINAPIGTEMGTPLVKAAYNGWLKVAAYLLDHGAGVNIASPDVRWTKELTDFRRVTPLLAAVAAGNKAMAKFLIDRGADINFQGENGDTALHLAARKGFQAVVEVLLASNAGVNVKSTYDGTTPLFSAVSSGQVKIIQTLLAAGADAKVKDNKGRTALNYAIRTSPEIVQTLLAAGTNPNTEDTDGRTPLSYVAQRDSAEVVKLLLGAKADPNRGMLDAPLLCAIHEQSIASAAALLESGAKPDAPGKVDWQPHSVNFHYEGALGRGLATPLWLAVDMDQLPMVQLLLKYKADPNDALDGQSVLFRALAETNILAALLEAGGSAEARRPEGWSLLDSAVAQKQFAAVQLLLKHKADPNNSQIQGQSILFSALSETNILAALLNVGANVDPVTKADWNQTPLFVAARENKAAAVEILLKHGANPNVTDTRGDSALHYAAFDLSDKNVFALLLDHKGNPNQRNMDGVTPLDIVKGSLANHNSWPARFQNSAAKDALAEELIALLRQHGALDELPDFTRIRITRQGLSQPVEVFHKTGKLTNQFTLLETVMRFYASKNAPGQPWQGNLSALPFSDFGRIIIRRPSQQIGGKEQEIKVNLLNRSNVVDCAHDVPVEFGDVIEIPESVHALNAVTPKPVEEMEEAFTPASAPGSPGSFSARLYALQQPGGEAALARVNAYRTSTLCLQKTAQLVVAGETTTFKVNSWKEGFLSQALAKTEARSVLRSSSDLSRLTVTRKSGGSGPPAVFTVDVSGNAPNHDDLWLQEGDVIEVPEKP